MSRPTPSLVIDFFRVRGYHPLWPDFPDRSTKLDRLVPTGLFRVRSPLLTESRLISLPPGTEMFQFPGLLQQPMYSVADTAEAVGFPIRTSSDQSLFASSRSISQATTSFIAFYRLGIHHIRLFA